MERPPNDKPMPHRFTLAVWKKSMSLRYAIEALLFFVVLLVFQFEISAFNKDLHLSIREMHEFELLNDEIFDHGGERYDPSIGSHRFLSTQNVTATTESSARILVFEHIDGTVDLSSWTLEELYAAQEELHKELHNELVLSGKEIRYSANLAAITFLFPVQLLNKFVFAQCEGRSFYFSSSNVIDMTIFGLVVFWWQAFEVYSNSHLDFPLFGEPEDSIYEISLMRSIIYDIEYDIFHTDYLLAAITALFWFRCIVLLRLSEYFGPIIEMIYAMLILFVQFMILYVLELVTFSCIAALTISENPNFANLFEALRTYLDASLGNFDLRQYDDYEGFKGSFGLILHVLVLFVNMILIINLLIAIMSDTYARMSDLRVGLYWATVIKEMPKYRYH